MGQSGTNDGQFESPWGVTVDGAGNVFVVEQSGVYVRSFPGPFRGLPGTEVRPQRRLHHEVWWWIPQGNMVDGQLNGPRNAVVDTAGIVYVADTGFNRIQKFKMVVPLAAHFTGDVMSGEVPLTVKFTDTSTGTPVAWSWAFGDGSTSTERNPTHEYTATGTFTVALTVTDATGAKSTTTDTVGVTATPVPEFPSAFLPLTMIIGVLGAVLLIQRTRYH